MPVTSGLTFLSLAAEPFLNIFVLDRDIPTCARYHADQHVVKMILESAQMLCTVINLSGGRSPYKSTHPQHPCTLWQGLHWPIGCGCGAWR